MSSVGRLRGLTLRLLVAVVQHDVGGVVHARGQILHGPLAELVHPEDKVVDVGDAVDVVLEDVYAEGEVEVCGGRERVTGSMMVCSCCDCCD